MVKNASTQLAVILVRNHICRCVARNNQLHRLPQPRLQQHQLLKGLAQMDSSEIIKEIVLVRLFSIILRKSYKNSHVLDIDECTSNPCSQELICVNKNGGYVCEISHCGKGFKLKGRECIDIDECESNPCPLTHNCINKKGSFTCKHKNCPSGYKLSAIGECEDVNECQDREHLRCSNGYCVNTNGSFYCNCNPGYKKNGRVHCYDIDECAENIHGCSHQCINEFGGYRCSCDNGFRLNSDQRTCDDIDECSENGDLLCRGDCENTYGGYECRCPAGFRNHSSFCVGEENFY